MIRTSNMCMKKQSLDTLTGVKEKEDEKGGCIWK